MGRGLVAELPISTSATRSPGPVCASLRETAACTGLTASFTIPTESKASPDSVLPSIEAPTQGRKAGAPTVLPLPTGQAAATLPVGCGSQDPAIVGPASPVEQRQGREVILKD